MKRFVSIIIAILAMTSISKAADYWVWQNGSDTDPGTIANPFKTITQACNVVIAGDVIHIYRGDYIGEVDANINQSGVQIIGELTTLPPGMTDFTGLPEKPTIRNFELKISNSGVNIRNMAFLFDIPLQTPIDINVPQKGAIHLLTNTSGAIIEDCVFTRINGGFATDQLENLVGIINNSPVASLTIRNNIFTGWRSGIFLWDANIVEIIGNIFESNLVGVSVRGPMYPNGVIVTNNQFLDNRWEAIGVGSGTSMVNSLPVMTATSNSFVNNASNGFSFTINNYINSVSAAFIINAANNWWDDTNGPFEDPEFADALAPNHSNPLGKAVLLGRIVNSPNVEYMPWLSADPFIFIAGDPSVVLWFDPMRMDNTNPLVAVPPLPTTLPANNEKVPFWINQGNPLACTSAVVPLPLPWKEPVFKSADFQTPWLGLNGWPGVKFTEKSRYGESSVMTFPASPLVTSNWPTAPMYPVVANGFLPQESKNLFIAFKASDLQSITPQILFEVGGAISGFNAYIQNGYLIMGIWNRLESAFFQMTEPLNAETHIAHLEFQYNPPIFNPENGQVLDPGIHQVRMILDGNPSPWASLNGLQFDPSLSGIGAAVGGTMLNGRKGIFNDYARHFSGLIGDIKLYSGPILTPDVLQIEYAYFNERYGTAPSIVEPIIPAKNSAWIVNSESKPEKDNNGKLADIFPNPSGNMANVSINLSEAQNIRMELFDMAGVKMLSVYEGNASKGLSSYSINSSNLPTGVYTLRISGSYFISTDKLIISK